MAREVLLKGGVEKRPWLQADRCLLRVGWTNSTRKSGAKDIANTRDPTMFAAASDTAVGRVDEYKALFQNYSMFTFDVTLAYSHAWEDEVVFLETPPEEIEEHGDYVWR